jgi:hypothetical protein
MEFGHVQITAQQLCLRKDLEITGAALAGNDRGLPDDMHLPLGT